MQHIISSNSLWLPFAFSWKWALLLSAVVAGGFGKEFWDDSPEEQQKQRESRWEIDGFFFFLKKKYEFIWEIALYRAGRESNDWNCVLWLTSVPALRLVTREGIWFEASQGFPSSWALLSSVSTGCVEVYLGWLFIALHTKYLTFGI